MIVITSLFNLPFLILIWLIETYLLLVAIRFLLAAIPALSHSHVHQKVKLLTDAAPDFVGRHLSQWTDSAVPAWVPWVIVVLSACMLRQLLISILFMHVIQQP